MDTVVIYYKGILKDNSFATKRLSNVPNYFSVAEVSDIQPDLRSSKGDRFAILKNYWRYGTRKIISHSDLKIIFNDNGCFIPKK